MMPNPIARLARIVPLILLSTWPLIAPAGNEDLSRVIPSSGVIGTQEAMLSPDYWIARTRSPDAQLMTREQVMSRNRQTFARDRNLVDLARVGPTLSRAQILSWLGTVSSPLTTPPVDAAGRPISQSTLAAVRANMGVEGIPAAQPTRYGMAVRRAQLRTYPTSLKAFPLRGLTDFESFQGGILFPGDAVVILQRSVDGKWLLVQTWQGPAWVATIDIAEGSRHDVLAYASRTPYRVVSGDEVRTVHTPEAPDVSELQLDMGARVPLADLPAGQPVNGEGSYASWPIVLPTRDAEGKLRFSPALLPKTRDSAPDYLSLTRANIIHQAFKFLGERYGWGHLYNARDCSGFTSDVYRSMGVVLPPNSGAQGQSPAFHHQLFTKADSHEARLRAIMAADVGDLIVVPGHVQMILGKVGGQPYIIQDVPYAIFRDASGKLHKTLLNQVAVTPLLPLLYDDTHGYVDAMTSLVHVTAP
jgi:SH3 domain containing protein/NlpC/P60 family protein